MKKRTTTDGLKILDSMVGDDPALRAMMAEARINADVAAEIYKLRTKAKVSQKELAKRVGTTQSVISRLEDADYDGHSLSMLQRIAAALDSRVQVRFLPTKHKA